ncbi:ribonuclease H-like domain-containing protein [Haloferax sulfurifontis]|uniref:YprB ribonuclease H-like domain-containing protein n=2 Tax=Haloferax sulfurifontis TaxID=255616 RepID=M0IIG8_9EURY|nr:ribonuclease H-like domain-containing protein [Haloferax sulfurifontis]ELZ96571.1 hypothetical protein C441_04364 [Haloferax sulfurifontis ATCC BAA-897]GGC72750.1 hypothetical protein GCM10007209_38430 [Haloferax sulfurifontis]
MRFQRDDHGFGTVATLDIETTHYDAERGEVVSVGIGHHELGAPAGEAEYELFHRDVDGEPALITRSMDYLNGLDADGLVTYNGRGFDVEFLVDRMYRLGEDNPRPELDGDDTHIDIFADRKQRADQRGEKWPALEECLESYDLPVPKTLWNGRTVTNKLFGREVGPVFLDAVASDSDDVAAFHDLIDHYLRTDLEANLALYYADIGRDFEPVHLGTETSVDV